MFGQNKNINVTRYLALGDSITSGYVDGALCYEGQQNCYANIIANQFKLFGGGDFKQPLVSEFSVGIGFAGNACLLLENNTASLEPTASNLAYMASAGDSDIFSTNVFFEQGPFNNMGVPGTKIINILMEGLGNPGNGAGNYNPFFTRMASDYKTASVISEAVKIDATFFSLFIGNNDAFAYALSGGTSDEITPLSGTPGKGFIESVSHIVNVLTSKGAQGVIANLAGIASIPFFTAIPFDGLYLSSGEALELNEMYKTLGIKFHEGKNPFLINDPLNELERFKQLKRGDLVLMDVLLDKEKLNYLTGKIPIPKKYILNTKEILKIENAISGYNAAIRDIAKEKNLAFVDVNNLMEKAKGGMSYNASLYKMEYKNRSVFSLDGLHPTAFGQALLANEFLRAINTTYGSEIPSVKIMNYKGITLV